MMKEWQIGLLSGSLTAISFIFLDLFFSLPYVMELVIALAFTLTGTIIGNKLLSDRRKHKENAER